MKVKEDCCDICNNKGILVTRLPNKDFYLKLCGDCFTKYAKGKESFFGQCDICHSIGNNIAKKVKVFSFLKQNIKNKIAKNLCINCLKKEAEELKDKIEEYYTVRKKLILSVNKYLADKVPFSQNIESYFNFQYNKQDEFRFGDIGEVVVKMYEGFIKKHSSSYRMYYTNNSNKFGCLLLINHNGVVEIPDNEEWDENYVEAAKAFMLKLQS